MTSNYLGQAWKEKRSKRIRERKEFLKKEYSLSDREAYGISWELERLAYKEKQLGKTP